MLDLGILSKICQSGCTVETIPYLHYNYAMFYVCGEVLSPDSFPNLSISFHLQAACPPALLTHRLMSQGREEERRRIEEEKRRVEEGNLRRGEKRGEEKRGEKRGGEERPLYESIYSLAGSPGGICPPPTKSTLDQIHPLQLQVARHISFHLNTTQQNFFCHTLCPSAAAGCDWGRGGTK